MRQLLNDFVDMFGFDSFNDFTSSMIHFNLLKITIPFGGVIALFSHITGFEEMTTTAFLVMVVFELVSGLLASKVEGKEIQSRKLSRFGFKLLTWLVLIFIVNAFAKQYQDQGILGWLVEMLKDTVVGYILFEYVLSIVENLERITGKEIALKRYINGLFDKFINKQ